VSPRAQLVVFTPVSVYDVMCLVYALCRMLMICNLLISVRLSGFMYLLYYCI